MLHRIASLGDAVDSPKRLRRKLRSSEPKSIPVVVGSYLSRKLRAALETERIGYVDSRGRFHLPWAEGLVHVEDRSAGLASKRTLSTTLGVHGVRAVQTVLDRPTEIKVTEVAARARLSPSATHAVLKILEREGLVRSTGSGPKTKRTVIDRSLLLDWLAAQPAARRRERHVDVVYYGRNLLEALRRASRSLSKASVPHAFTGAAAASVLGVGPTSLALASVRIGPETSFEDAIAILGAEETERGANLRLVRDTGSVGSIGSIERDELQIAPFPRIYLDLLGERRGEDLAQHFREVTLGY